MRFDRMDFDINPDSLMMANYSLYTFSDACHYYSYYVFYTFWDGFIPSESFFLNREATKFQWGDYTTQKYVFFMAVLLDYTYRLVSLSFPYLNDFSHNIIYNPEINLFIPYHPEILIVYKNVLIDFYNNYYGYIYILSKIATITESYFTVVMDIYHLIIFVCLFIICLHFFLIINFDVALVELVSDYEFFCITLLSECEEEIASMDDMVIIWVIFSCLFFWFFGIHFFWIIFSFNVYYTVVLSCIPLLYFMIFIMPFALLYDFGSYFLAYLNGVSKSPYILIESFFDYISIAIFMLRLLVQNVRLVFMLFTFYQLHHFIIETPTEINSSIISDVHISQDSENIVFKKEVNSLFLLNTFFTWFFNLLYELFHTFFMLVFQFVAFFAMIFWLFLFLYTMFGSELLESYYRIKRKVTIKMKLHFFKKKKELLRKELDIKNKLESHNKKKSR